MNREVLSKESIIDEIYEFYKRMIWRFPVTGEPCLDAPVVRFASARDPLFDVWRHDPVSPLISPQEGFSLTFGLPFRSKGTVISWALPISSASRKTNSENTDLPSEEWVLSRHHGERFNNELRAFAAEYLSGKGVRTVAGQTAFWWKKSADSVSANWSERHAAYAAGHGTFSLCGGLITEKGIAVRLGSVITDIDIEPDDRNNLQVADNCLHFRNGSCGACIRRCPVGAITSEGLDKIKCLRRLYGNESVKLAESYGGAVTAGCGLCQTNVPCEFRNPAVLFRSTER